MPTVLTHAALLYTLSIYWPLLRLQWQCPLSELQRAKQPSRKSLFEKQQLPDSCNKYQQLIQTHFNLWWIRIFEGYITVSVFHPVTRWTRQVTWRVHQSRWRFKYLSLLICMQKNCNLKLTKLFCILYNRDKQDRTSSADDWTSRWCVNNVRSPMGTSESVSVLVWCIKPVTKWP